MERELGRARAQTHSHAHTHTHTHTEEQEEGVIESKRSEKSQEGHRGSSDSTCVSRRVFSRRTSLYRPRLPSHSCASHFHVLFLK